MAIEQLKPEWVYVPRCAENADADWSNEQQRVLVEACMEPVTHGWGDGGHELYYCTRHASEFDYCVELPLTKVVRL